MPQCASIEARVKVMCASIVLVAYRTRYWNYLVTSKLIIGRKWFVMIYGHESGHCAALCRNRFLGHNFVVIWSSDLKFSGIVFPVTLNELTLFRGHLTT